MSKRRKKVEQLPLDSPKWMPLAEALHLLRGLSGNPYLADKDLFAAVAAKRSDKQLPCMQRLIAREVAPDQDRKIVPPADATPVYLGREDAAFFVWRPKFEEIWPALAASAPARSSPARIEAPPSRRRGPATTHDWMSICGEIAARCINPRDGRLVVPVKDSAIVASMRIWFLDKNLAVPATTEMSEAVRRVCAPLREVQRKVPRKVR
jgi:hypothetical protein